MSPRILACNNALRCANTFLVGVAGSLIPLTTHGYFSFASHELNHPQPTSLTMNARTLSAALLLILTFLIVLSDTVAQDLYFP
ncbi:hypothetical protein [Rhodohalobacter sp. SW132]|uniref:hypothetical protein n=1 Tax=Rhodohalobacter sp. SW132 TaxID=2293433 RepID=UPI0011C05529|nr:hypothetical protein [Rhodohalobacter sp. SW132]